MKKDDSRIILTLDAGGTKFSFSAIAAAEEVVTAVERPSNADNLAKCLDNLYDGFAEIQGRLKGRPAAISFAFPGPSYYEQGVIGDLGNLPAFRGGVPLGPMLQDRFGIPVFINNDGDLFALGEAVAGFLPLVNQKLKEHGSVKRYKNLTGFTLGTGFGGGITHNGKLYTGDNSASGEVWLMRNPLHIHTNIEESVSIRAIQRGYRLASAQSPETDLTAKEIYQIAKGEKSGDQAAARSAFSQMGEALGECIRNVLTLTDSLVVLGGGLSAAYDIFSEAMFRALRKPLSNFDQSREISGLEIQCFDLLNASEEQKFLQGDRREIPIPGTPQTISIDTMKRTAVGKSILGTSKAVSIGAWVHALNALDKT